MLEPSNLPGVSASDARVLIAEARSIAPCLDRLEGEDRLIAIAILTRASAELPEAGSRRLRSQSRNGASVTLDGFTSAFSAGDRAALRALCGSATARAAAPVGEFPAAGLIEQNWPEP